MQDATNRVSLFFIVCRICLSPLTLYNTSSFLTWSVQLIFSIFLQRHISKLSRYFSYTFRSVQVSAACKAISKCSTLLSFFRKLKSNLLVKSLFLVEICFCHGNPACTSFVIRHHATQIVEIFSILRLFFIYHDLYWGWLPWESHHFSFPLPPHSLRVSRRNGSEHSSEVKSFGVLLLTGVSFILLSYDDEVASFHDTKNSRSCISLPIILQRQRITSHCGLAWVQSPLANAAVLPWNIPWRLSR